MTHSRKPTFWRARDARTIWVITASQRQDMEKIIVFISIIAVTATLMLRLTLGAKAEDPKDQRDEV